jgi:trk system potassium uptake protein TrkA
VIGCGRVGWGLAIELTNAGHSVAIIDNVPRSFRRLPADRPGQRVVGYGLDRNHLEEAGVKDATSFDEVVLLVSAQCEDDEIRELLLQGS